MLLVMAGLDPAIHPSSQEHFQKAMDCRVKPGNDGTGEAAQHPTPQFSVRLLSGLSSENVGTSISNRSPLSLTIW